MKVLCAEDSRISRRMIRDAMQALDCEVIEADDGQRALDLIGEHGTCLDAILLDWSIPTRTGLEVLQEIRRDARLGDIPVVMVSALSSEEHIRQALEAGANDYVKKPFKADDLIAKVRHCVEHA